MKQSWSETHAEKGARKKKKPRKSSSDLDKQICQFFGIKPWDDWKHVATHADQWMVEMDETVHFFWVKSSRVCFRDCSKNFEHFLPARALNRAAFSSCEPRTQTLTHRVASRLTIP